MPIVRLQSEKEKLQGIYYEFDSSDQPLGEGGMGRVYKGRCIYERTGAAREIAIKFMFDDMPDHVIERARREASIQLRNDNLVEMLGFIEISERSVLGEIKKRHHVVSELLRGVMLDDLLKGKTTDQFGHEVPFATELYNEMRTKPYKFAIRVIRNVLSGLMALHNAGYIHRDIDPTNIMVTYDNKIKLIDFGIAKQLTTLNTSDKALTSSGQFIGKPWYAAPELVLGDIQHQNQTTDIYAIGILFFQLITGNLPFDGAHHEVLSMQLKKKMPLRDIPAKYSKVRPIIEKATQKKQNKRFQSASEFIVSLEQLPLTPSEKVIPWKPISIAACSTLVVGGFLVFSGNNDNIEPTPGKISIRQATAQDVYNEAVNMLRIPHTADRGLELLDSLSETNHHKASYLLSRIYFESEKDGDYCSEEVKEFKRNLHNIRPDNKKAHELLIQTVQYNQKDYKALYELGCDYLGGNQRNKSVARDISSAHECLNKAKQYAEASNDTLYTKLITEKLEGYNWEIILKGNEKK